PSRNCVVKEPVVVNLYVEPYEGDDGPASVAPTQMMSESGPPHNETTPSITLTETTTKTTITS
ncbi:hypothetical protein OSTOST_23736, partial [Ostertagia ostertagi]